MSLNETFICVVIPTRDRAKLAMNAINSALADKQLRVRVLVSDNSTKADDVELLSNFCHGIDDQRLIYKRVPNCMDFGDHWEWAVQQALADHKVTHVLFLTDRMVFKRNELAKILPVVNSFPDSIISYNQEGVDDLKKPVTLVQESWTGRLYAVDSTALLRLSSNMIILYLVPRMMNCVVPRAIFAQLRNRYGNVFEATAPDFIFAFRSLEYCDKILYLDRVPLVHYSANLSMGGNQGRGILPKEAIDSFNKLGDMNFNYAAPVPGIITPMNSMIHAYQVTKMQSHSTKFPHINRELYYEIINKEIGGITDPGLQAEMRALLSGQVRRPKELRRQKLLKLWKPIFSWKSWCVKFWWILTDKKFQSIWNLMDRYLGIKKPALRQFKTECDSTEAALEYNDQHPYQCYHGITYLESLGIFKRLPFP